jgi:intein/homing endonuclease
MVRLEINNRTTKLSGDQPTLALLYKLLRFRHPNAFHIRKSVGRGWDGFINPMSKTGMIKTGLLEYALKKLVVELEEEDFEIIDNRLPLEIGDIPKEVGGLKIHGNEYHYQHEVIKECCFHSLLGQPHQRGVVVAAVNAGKCIKEGSLIPLYNRGLTPVEKVSVRDLVLTEKGYREVIGTEYTGEISTISLTTKRGYYVESGYDRHRLKVWDGEWVWKYSRDFKEGDLVPIKYGDKVEGSIQEVLGIPINTDIGYFLGCVHGDGCIGKSFSITSHTQDKELLLNLRDTIIKYFPKSKGEEDLEVVEKIHHPDNGHLHAGRNSLMDFLNFFEELSGGAFEKRIPTIIFQSPLEVQRAYLQGYFDTDGSVNFTRPKCSLSSVSLEGLQDTKQLLLNFGIITTYDNKKTSWQKGKGTTNRFHISGYSLELFKAIGFRLPRKKARLEEIEVIRNNRYGGSYVWKDWDVFPIEFEHLLEELLREAYVHKLKLQQFMWERILRAGNNFTRYIVREQLKAWPELSHLPLYKKVEELNSYFWDRVDSIEKSTSRTWDLEVEGTHSYIGNGFINHNTNIMFGIHMAVKEAKTIILLDNTTLYKQMKSDLAAVFPDDYGYMKGKEIKWGSIMVVMVQTLVNRLQEYDNELKKFNVLLTDECDLATSKTFEKVYNNLAHITMRLGFTGTAFLRNLKKDMLRNTRIREVFGDKIFEITMKELEDRGVSTKTIIKLIQGPPVPIDHAPDSFKDEWDELVTFNKKHHKIIANRVKENLKLKRKYIMIFCRFIPQVEETYDYLCKQFPNLKIGYAHHKSNYDDVIKDFREGKLNILVNSLFLKRGLNLPMIRVVINASGGEFYSNPLQITGRGVRKHKSKNRFYLEDILQKGKYLTKHSLQRIKYYKQQKLQIKDLR